MTFVRLLPPRLAPIVLVILLMGLTALALPQQVAVPNISINVGGAKGADNVSTSLQILALLTVLSLAPAILILTTAFTRIVIIFGFLRQALGTQNIPPNQVLIGLSLFLTFFVMGPTYAEINETALKPVMNGQMKLEDAVERAQKPLKEFMLKNTYKKDLVLFANLRNEKPETREEISMLTVIPAFIISELKTAFIIGFYIFIPFLIIDLIIASGLMSMGMMMLPPVVVSLPAKVLVFVLADGWSTLVTAIMQGYR
ncbi:MAG TPA: flagellar type III secretion system pore protein FliP [Fimbriimonadaceae bacterium]|nr:flagellar type III secretion system pore protein FliP [Fimbriimonadaceae bacterium]